MQRAVAGAVKDSLTKPDWAHVFLTVIQPLALHQPQQKGQTASALRAACAGLMSKHSSRLRRAGVVQWEVRLRMPEGLPAWRVVVSSPTGAFKLMKPLRNTMNGSMKAASCAKGCVATILRGTAAFAAAFNLCHVDTAFLKTVTSGG